MKLPILREFEWSKVGSYRNGNPYVIAFCYPHPEFYHPFLVKGGYQSVSTFLEALRIPMIVHRTIWISGHHRKTIDTYHLSSKYEYLIHKTSVNNVSLFTLSIKNKKTNTWTNFYFRRVPRKWIRELDDYLINVKFYYRTPKLFKTIKIAYDKEGNKINLRSISPGGGIGRRKGLRLSG